MALHELIAKRQALDLKLGYRRRRADHRHFSTDWIKRQRGRVYLGTECVTLADAKVKYVDRWSAYYPYTPGELARIYLDDLIKAQLGWHHISDHYKLTDTDKELLEIQAPLYFNPRLRRGRFVYIDINACYFELFKDHALNMGFDLATGRTERTWPALTIPREDHAWLRAAKPLRHAMFGMMSSQSVSWYKDGKAVTKRFLSDYAAPELVAYVKTQLRQIARIAVEEFGCLMWLTDAGIFEWRRAVNANSRRASTPTDPAETGNISPNNTAHDFQSWLLSKGLSSSVKASGMGYLWGLGDYRVGRMTSKGSHVDMPGFSNL